MSILYNRLLGLCADRGITGYRMSKDAGVSVNLMTDLKSGRKKGISAEVADKLATYFNVSVSYLLGTEEQEKPAGQVADGLTEEDIKLLSQIKKAPEEKKRAILELLKGWEE